MRGHRAEETAHLWVASCGPGFPCGTHSSWQHCPHTQVPISSCCCTDLRPELTSPYQKVLLKQPCVSIWGTVTFILDFQNTESGPWGSWTFFLPPAFQNHGAPQPLTLSIFLFCLGFLTVWSEDLITNLFDWSAPLDPGWLASYLFVCFCICCYQTVYIRQCIGEPVYGNL